MAFTFNSRTLDYRSSNIKVKYRDAADGLVKIATPTELDAASGALRSTLLTKSGVSGTTIEARKTAYAKDGSQNILDENDAILVNTWTTGVQPKYVTENLNTNFLVDTTA